MISQKFNLKSRLFFFALFVFLGFVFFIALLFYRGTVYPNIVVELKSLGKNIIITRSVAYKSTLDELDLMVDVAFDKNKKDQPIILMLQGYSGSFDEGNEIIHRFAQKGAFAVKVHKRGFGGSQGTSDDSGREIYDIYDAAEFIKKTYLQNVDGGNVNIVGYSGGGGNAYGLAVKFPDYFRSIQVFWGMSDYGYDDARGWWNNGGLDYHKDTQSRIGGTPLQKKDNYYSRAHYLGAKNNPYSSIQLFYDEEDVLVPLTHGAKYLEQARLGGLNNVILRITGNGDKKFERFIHAFPFKKSKASWGNMIAEDYFIPGIISGSYSLPELKASGEMFISGYVRTRSFRIILGNGNDEAANLVYDISGSGDSLSPKLFNIEGLTGESAISFEIYNLFPNVEYFVVEKKVGSENESNIRVAADSAGTLRFEGILAGISAYRVFRAR